MLCQLCSQRTALLWAEAGKSRGANAGAHNHLNDNTFALASLEASKPGGAAAKQSLEKYYQKMDKSKGVFKD